MSALGLATAVSLAPAAHAASPDLVVNQVYGGGGNSGAPYASDYVELFNRSTNAVDLTGWTVQYWSASGTTAQKTPLTGSIGAGGRFLVKEADGANTSAQPLPTPDATGTIPMAATGGRVAIVNPAGTVVDLLGWGAATASEGAPAGATNNSTAVFRSNACIDTDNNAADFTTGTPTPQNSTTAPVDCSGATPPPAGTPATIAQIQGAAHISPMKGQQVTDVKGVVIARNSGGFWMQSTTPDNDPATSEGVYVYTRTAPAAAVGDAVSVNATVTEFRPGGTSGTDNLTTTELTTPTVTVTSSGNPLPAPVVIGQDRIAPQQNVESGDPGSVENTGVPFDPTVDAIDFDESMEGMRVALSDARAVGPTNLKYGETAVVPGQNVTATQSPRGGVLYGSYSQPNSMRLILDDALVPAGTIGTANVGDVYRGQTVGVLDYAFSNFRVMVTQAAPVQSAGLQREVTAAAADGQLAMSTFNVENLAPSDPDTKYQRLATQIVRNLQAPDIIALEEIQDNSGAADDGTVDSTTTSDKLIAAITAAGGPAYQARWVNPENDKDGGQPGGNIRQVFIFRTDRGVSFVDKPGGTATTATTVVGTGDKTTLSVSPGRIDPTNSAWSNSRKPLVGQFRWNGKSVFVIANHFNSKGGDDPLFGRWQQPQRSSETQRNAQAQVVRSFVDSLLKADAGANVAVVGDLNDFEFSKTADILVGSGTTALTDLPRTLPANDRYTYIYEGNSQVLDHILMSPSLVRGFSSGATYAYDIVHTNSEFADQDSDHDPQVVRVPVQATR
ncbi:lamin tail domain-containing protein [Metallococcus carri]|uniref:lamin tail domain-containing protein n=1 Tax=Metallococcus carri TaxID=1656884 RepID=UPI002E2D03C7|nr:lamin tail domain-containing protein [Metallococcus carri]